MIDGVAIRPLRQITDERGRVMHMLRADAPWFQSFGEIYFSAVYPGVVKAWHLHSRMALNYAVPWGRIKLVLYDSRPGSSSRGEIQEIVLGSKDQYALVTVPAHVWNGFQGLGDTESLIANCATIPHDPSEIQRLDPRDPSIPYDWYGRVSG